MNVASSPYLLFLLVTVSVYRLLGHRHTLSLVWILAVGMLYYALWNPLYCIPLLFTATLDYCIGRALGRVSALRTRRLLVAASIVPNLSVLVFFKYFNFAAANLAGIAHLFGATLPPMPFRVVFAVGISFYTFQSMSYVIDVYRREVEPAGSYLEYLDFVCFFPTLLAGPITRAETLLPQLRRSPAALTDEVGSRALFLIALGFVKKSVIADLLAVNLVNRVFDLPGMFSSLETLVGIYAYAAQIYCDFSGYSDIVIGSALLLGVRLKDNFNAPYRSRNLAEFWRRWHISFSTWLRDYLFFSLPGNRASGLLPYLNLVVTFSIGGLWHGASWNFLIWGILHGGGLAALRFYERLRPKRAGGAPAVAFWRSLPGTLLTFHFVCAAWVFFRCRTLADALDVFGRLGSLSFSAANLPWWLILPIVAGLLVQWLPERGLGRAQALFARMPALVQCSALLAVAASVRLAAGSAIAPFIYYSF